CTINHGARIYNNHVRLGGLQLLDAFVHGIRHVVLLGCGTSLYASQCAAHYFRKIPSIETTSVFDGAEFELNMLPKVAENGSSRSSNQNQNQNQNSTTDIDVASSRQSNPSIVVLLCSQSGETMDLIRCLNLLDSVKMTCITVGVINVVDSQIARSVDCGIYMNAGREVSVASTKAFVSALLVYYMAALWIESNASMYSSLSAERAAAAAAAFGISKRIDAIRDTIQSIYDMQHDAPVETQDAFAHIVNAIASTTTPNHDDFGNESVYSRPGMSLFVLGRGKLAHVAKECALKFKEMCYIHAEGCHSGSLKHGPFALLEPGFLVVLLVDQENQEKLMNTYEELKSREATILIVTDAPLQLPNKDNRQLCLYVPRNEHLSEIIFAHVMQRIIYQIAVRRGLNPDRPRNLAKVVTVE
ncbi:MAG: SIS domain-containing protein, partial [Bacteroidetes bacterium]|nr:SIS domain-containing protein [Bacteroidota bacterium]